MATIMTLGRKSRRFVLRGRSETLTSDFREIHFSCNFVGDAVNGAPKIRVSVGELGKGKPDQIRVEIIPPDNGASAGGNTSPVITEVVLNEASTLPAISGRGISVTAENHRFVSTIAGDTGNSVTDLNDAGVSRLVNTGAGPITGIDDNVVIDEPFPPTPPLDPPGGGGGGPIREVIVQDLVPGTDPGGRWRVRLHNLADDAREFLIDVEYPESVQNLRTTRVPFQLVNRAFAEALLLIGPQLAVNDGRARLKFTSEFKKLTGLDDITSNVSKRLKNIRLESLVIRLGREPEFQNPAVRIGLELENRGDEIDVFGPDGNITDMSMELDLVLHMVSPPNTDFFRTAMLKHDGEVIPRQVAVLTEIHTNPGLRGHWINFLDWISGLIGDSFDDMVADMVEKARRSINSAMQDGGAAYLQDILTHLVERDHVLHTIRADANDLIVQHHAKPDPFGRPAAPGGPVVVSEKPGTPASEPGGVTAGVGSRPVTGSLSGASRVNRPVFGPNSSGLTDTFGPELPEVSHPDGTVPAIREGEIEHIVFLMMENRSFDHMLGYRALKALPVNGLSGNEENAIADGNRPYRAKHLTRTSGIPSPGHHFDDVKEQVAEGAMSGFASNYLKRNGVYDPGLIMGYYTQDELPMYEFIANNYAICDAWYCSHPGPTWPNRFCATTGQAPEVENFDVSDERIGYFKGTSIFDLLDRFGVDWCYAEGNISFLRMFDRYRLDVRHVIPFRDDFGQGIEDTWERRVLDGRLPAVSYIDPRFIDIPPAFDANDDLPPTDVCHGQQLVKRIYELLTSDTRNWSRTLLVITYDEHGGFFDHVPPPGTPTADDVSPQPKIHPDGAEHLGVRVPALIVSPWIDAGTVISTPFDHTSIIKTILQRFAPDEFASGAAFGPRTEQANSIFDVLRDSPRLDTLDAPKPPEIDCRHSIQSRRGSVSAIERDDFHSVMRLMSLSSSQRASLLK